MPVRMYVRVLLLRHHVPTKSVTCYIVVSLFCVLTSKKLNMSHVPASMPVKVDENIGEENERQHARVPWKEVIWLNRKNNRPKTWFIIHLKKKLSYHTWQWHLNLQVAHCFVALAFLDLERSPADVLALMPTCVIYPTHPDD